MRIYDRIAWFVSHRIREAMGDGKLAPMDGNGGIVEAEETYLLVTKEPKISKHRRGRTSARLLERSRTLEKRSFRVPKLPSTVWLESASFIKRLLRGEIPWVKAQSAQPCERSCEKG